MAERLEVRSEDVSVGGQERWQCEACGERWSDGQVRFRMTDDQASGAACPVDGERCRPVGTAGTPVPEAESPAGPNGLSAAQMIAAEVFGRIAAAQVTNSPAGALGRTEAIRLGGAVRAGLLELGIRLD